MLETFLITGRETLEASLIVGIVLATLHKTHRQRYTKTVWWGVAAGVVISIIAALLFTFVAGGFEGRAEQIFEGTTMLLGAILLTSMIVWMSKQRHVARELEEKVDDAIHIHDPFASRMALFGLIVVAIVREGVETVIFLGAANYASGISLIAGLLGIAAAIVLGYFCFVSFSKITLSRIFSVSSILLILFAAGLVAHSVHEFEEAGLVPQTQTLYDASHILSQERMLGSFLAGFFGYSASPTLLEALVYMSYLISALFFFTWKMPKATRS